MAELALKVGDSGTYEDGDVLDAFNRRRIRCCHAQHICHIGLAAKQPNGRRVANSLAEMYRQQTHQFRFTRISRTEVVRLDQWTLEEETFSDAPNAKGEYINVQKFVNRRLENDLHGVFGQPGSEIWYGGRTKVDHAALDGVWAEIEKRTPQREADYTLWPAGTMDLRSYFFISVDEFDDTALEDLKAPLLDRGQLTPDGAPTVVKKRKNNVDWKKDLGISAGMIADIQNPAKTIDGREAFSYLRDNIIAAKSLS